MVLLSLPALGGLWLRRRTRDVVVPVLDHLVAEMRRQSRHRATESPSLSRLASRHDIVIADSDSEVQIEVVSRSRSGLRRLIAGMVRVNRPWKLALGLSTALAGALTGTAFGVLYSAIWQLGAALSPLRLAAVTLGATSALVVWLIVGHDLWERGPGASWRVAAAWLRNAAMLVTVTFGALMFFVLLFVIAVVAAVVVIPPEYLAQHVKKRRTGVAISPSV